MSRITVRVTKRRVGRCVVLTPPTWYWQQCKHTDSKPIAIARRQA